MARFARVVVPGAPSRRAGTVQRGNRRMKTFFGNDDCEACLSLLTEWCGLRHENTGRPLGHGAFVKKLESLLGRQLTPRKPGPKPRKKRKSRTTRTAKKQV